MSDKIYAKGIYLKEFGKYGDIKMSIKYNDLIPFLQGHVNDKGYVNLIISKRREEGQYGDTHYAHLDTWKKEEPKEPRVDSPYIAPEDSSQELPF